MASRVVLRTFNYRHEAEVVTHLLVAEEDLHRATDFLSAADAMKVR